MGVDPEIVRTIIAEIEAAFSGMSAPGDAKLLHPLCMDDGDIKDFYGVLDRGQLTDDIIINNYAAPSFFSMEAFQYFMPAFMIWSLKHHDSIEYVTESTIRAFYPTSEEPKMCEFQVSKFTLFTERQCAAVVKFLQSFSSDPDLGPIAGDALTNYWLRQDPVSK